MGYTTDILGTAAITPKLNEAEAEYLQAFAQSRRWDRPEGPYFVPAHPLLDNPSSYHPDAEEDRFNHTAPGQPSMWCDWTPVGEGCCLTYDGVEKFRCPAEWLYYLIEHFLRPGGKARRSGDPQFEEFSFDHRVNGLFVARRRDNGTIWLIAAKDHQVSERTLVRGVEGGHNLEVLPYEKDIDSWLEGSRRRRVSDSDPVILEPCGNG